MSEESPREFAFSFKVCAASLALISMDVRRQCELLYSDYDVPGNFFNFGGREDGQEKIISRIL